MSGSGLVGNLIEILKEQTAIYSEMLELSFKKREIIKKNEVDGLKAITTAENGLVGKSQRLEKSRLELIKDIALVLNQKPEKMTLEYIIEAIKERPEAEEIRETARALRQILTKLKDINELNRELIQNSLDYIDFSINVIRSTVGDGPAFSSPYGDSYDGSGGFFDVRQ